MPKAVSESLADLIVTAVKRAPLSQRRTAEFKALEAAANDLPKTKSLSYDESALNITQAMVKSFDREEIVGQLGHATFPNDLLWIVGPSPFQIHQSLTDKPILGFLVSADQEKLNFTFQVFRKDHISGLIQKDVMQRNGISEARLRQIGYFSPEGWYPATMLHQGVIPTVSAADGIDFDEDRLLDLILKNEERAKRLGTHDNYLAFIDYVYESAMFLSSFFVALSSRFPNNVTIGKTTEELELEKKNERRARQGFLPILSTTPVHIDLSEEDRKVLESGKAKSIRPLLGWTWVQRSRDIISKYGTIFSRKPHDRQIPAPVDRRDAIREITSSNPDVTVTLKNDRPVRVRKPADPSARAFS